MVLDFNIVIDDAKHPPIIRVHGEIDVYTCPKLRTALAEITIKKQHCIINLEQVQYIDSTGLGTLAQAALLLAKTGHQALVVCPSPQIRKIFEVSGLLKKNVQLFDHEADAIEKSR